MLPPLTPTHTASISSRAAKISRKRLSDITLSSILAGHTCSPIGLADLESYLALKEHSLENLHFVVWYQSYRSRYFAPHPTKDSGRQANGNSDALALAIPAPARTMQRIVETRRPSDAADCPSVSPTSSAFSVDYSPSPSRRGSVAPLLGQNASTSRSPVLSQEFPSSPASLRIPSGIGFASFPRSHARLFQAECARVAATFLSPGSPKELILDSEVRDTIIHELTWNIHPDIFLPAYQSATEALEAYSLPRFLTHASANINRPKQLYWYSVGLVDMTLAVLLAVMLIVFLPGGMSEASRRAWRLIAIPLFSVGSMQAYSAWRGFCSEVWGRGNTQLRVWELEGGDLEPPSAWASSMSSYSYYQDTQDTQAGLPRVHEDEREDCALCPHLYDARRKFEAIPQDAYDDPAAIPDFDVDSALHGSCAHCAPDAKRDESVDPHSPSPTSLAKPSKRGFAAAPSTSNTALSFDLWGWERASTVGPAQGTQKKSRVTRNALRAEARAEYKRPPIFGPERPVLDPRIQAVHRAVMRDMLVFGFVCTVVFTAIVLAVPSVRHY